VEAGELSVSGNVVHGSGLERGYVPKGPRSEHGMRLIALDPHTVQALGARQERRRSRLGQWNDTLAEDACPLLSGRGRPAPCAPRHDGQAVRQAGRSPRPQLYVARATPRRPSLEQWPPPRPCVRVSLDLVRPRLGDLRQARLAETLFSSSSHVTWPGSHRAGTAPWPSIEHRRISLSRFRRA
jgi:hypothetical protein